MLKIGSRISDLISDIVLTPVSVTEVEHLAKGFTRVRITGDAISRSHWTPGDKLQLRVRRGTVDLRTYTPLNWDAEQGTTDLIGFDHGKGQGAQWFQETTSGAGCDVFGPSRSIDLSDSTAAAIFVGDDTSVALAAALRSVNPAACYLFETTDRRQLQAVLAALDFDAEDFEIIAKTKDRERLLKRAREAATQSNRQYDVIVSGDAATVSTVRRAARHWQHPAPRIKARAYWATGRTGLS
jgi:NADPH-dependent ferric siderophore reductase